MIYEDKMNKKLISSGEIAKVLDNTLDELGNFREGQLLMALERMKLYPFVIDKKKSVPEYIEAGRKLDGWI